MPQLDLFFYDNAIISLFLFTGVMLSYIVNYLLPYLYATYLLDHVFLPSKTLIFKSLRLPKYTLRVINTHNVIAIHYHALNKAKFKFYWGDVKNASRLNMFFVPNTKSHPFLILSSCWEPLFISSSLILIFMNIPLYLLSDGSYNSTSVNCGTALFLFCVLSWVYGGVIFESTYTKLYNLVVRDNILNGVALFIISEIMLFFAFFWAFFNSALNPSFYYGNVWPPFNTFALSWYSLPLLNTALLVFSGFTANMFIHNLRTAVISKKGSFVNYLNFYPEYEELDEDVSLYMDEARGLMYLKLFILIHLRENKATVLTTILKHFFRCFIVFFTRTQVAFEFKLYYLTNLSAILYRDHFLTQKYTLSIQGLLLTILLGSTFLIFQYTEYMSHATFGLNNVYGTVFYTTTGLHGLHVFVGVSLLVLCLIRFHLGHYNTNPTSQLHMAALGSVWYWHFVDIVWIALWVVVYCWGC